MNVEKIIFSVNLNRTFYVEGQRKLDKIIMKIRLVSIIKIKEIIR